MHEHKNGPDAFWSIRPAGVWCGVFPSSLGRDANDDDRGLPGLPGLAVGLAADERLQAEADEREPCAHAAGLSLCERLVRAGLALAGGLGGLRPGGRRLGRRFRRRGKNSPNSRRA